MIEIEVKIKLSDPILLREKLQRMGAELIQPRHFENNVLYDYRDRSLFRKNQALRLRTVNRKAKLTFKGPLRKSRRFKIREEFETSVQDERSMRNIMKALGLIPVFTYEKYRTVYRRKKLKICLDETKAGDFIELEGERNEIVRFSEALGFQKSDFIKQDYIQLLKAKTEENKKDAKI